MRFFIALLFLVVPIYSNATWTPVAATSQFKIFTDQDKVVSISKIEKESLILRDFKFVQVDVSGKFFMSIISKEIFDCANKKTKTIEIIKYSGRMGAGIPVVKTNLERSNVIFTVTPGSPEEVVYKSICKKNTLKRSNAISKQVKNL